MAADGVVGQGRRLLVLAGDGTVGNKTELDQGLEAVADSQDKAVALVEKVADSLLDNSVPESGGKELRAAVRFVAGGKAAGEHDDLSLADLLRIGFGGIADILGGEIREHTGNSPGARALKCGGGVIFTVGAGEDRNEDGRLSDLVGTDSDLSAGIDRGLHCCFLMGTRIEGSVKGDRIVGTLGREHFLQGALPGCQHLLERDPGSAP